VIERFNFYDVYGYLIPGVTFLGLVWLPFGLVTQKLPPAEFLAALVVLVLGYIVGHILQILAAKAIPSKKKVECGERRHPSYLLLEDADTKFSPELKKRIVDRIQWRFGIDVSSSGNPDQKLRENRRNDAFLLCRTTLIKEGMASYAEQFEGMYVLMRGLTAAFYLGWAYHLGWLVGVWLPSSNDILVLWALIIVIIFSFVLMCLSEIMDPTEAIWPIRIVLPTIMGIIGVLLAWGKDMSPETCFLLLVTFLTSFFAMIECHGSYQSFASTFAERVYRDFAVV